MTSTRSRTFQVPWSRPLQDHADARAPDSGAAAGSVPRTFTLLLDGWRKPSRISTVVVLPAPFGAEQRDDLAAWDGEVQPVQDDMLAVGHDEVTALGFWSRSGG
ncbi:hypothetical protein [Serinicoccus marinus]|uniref:hypothetical protein n=1 Tax=Serinicoccus marinus TaxID=247333 RepID=UPI001EE7DE49|nr:hypothetical protein [Serinicoccus marinus]